MAGVKLIVMDSTPKDVPAFERVYQPSAGRKETLAHAAKISTGGPPVTPIVEEQTFTF